MIKQICEKYNRKYPKDLQLQVYGLTDRELCSLVVREVKIPISVDEFERQLNDLAQKMLPSAPLQKGAERLLTHLHDYKIPMALATNSMEQSVRLHATARPKLFGLFHHKISVTDPEVFRGKPNPDIFLVAASRFPDKPSPRQCLVFEDSAVGVQSAKEAGMQVKYILNSTRDYKSKANPQVVMIPDARLDREHTRHATLVIHSLLDFRPELFGLPPFDDAPRKYKRIEDFESQKDY
ncbi:jg13291 [Pararge aegeria aegeria]|uniref:Jg13291 protein n=1 Tax=Pararge aegeria aegeria TaxID=348720 RepID=A0A8S4RET7_9NEOP|nr:jg13291 [Pararge aegeria aegeria]